MTMSVAIFSSLLNINDNCCVPTWPTIWLLWRRIARNILIWLIAGSRMNKTTEITCSVNRTVPLRKAWSTIATKSQDAVVINAALFESVEKIKENLLSFSNFYIILKYDEVDEQGKMNVFFLFFFRLKKLRYHNLWKKTNNYGNRVLFVMLDEKYWLLKQSLKIIQNWIKFQPMLASALATELSTEMNVSCLAHESV